MNMSYMQQSIFVYIQQQEMGNCSTDQQHIVVPEDPSLTQTKFIKPQPTTFVIPISTNDPVQKLGTSGFKAKITKTANNQQQSAQLKQINQLKGNAVYVDHLFKTQKKSIGDRLSIDQLEWKRPQLFLKDQPILIQGEVETYDLKQGRLQNSYFVSALAALTNPLDLFRQIMNNVLDERQDPSPSGAYIIWLFIDGSWRQVAIDDQIPVVFNQYIFSNHRKELWIWLLEKAYAKVYKSYQTIQRGIIGYTLNALTGAPFQYLNKNSKLLVSPDDAWQFVKQAISHNHIVTVSTQSNDRNEYFQKQSKFSYTVMDCQEVYILTTMKKKRQRILKLDNPWGRYEWKGRWSQYSDVWSEELRHQLDYEKADDSIMWINLQDMLKTFGQVCACKYNADYINTSLPLEFKQQVDNQLKGAYINITTRTQGYLSLVQQDYRHYFKDYKYSTCRLILLHIDKQTSKPKQIISQKMDCDYYCTLPVQLKPGVYYLLIQMDWNCGFTRQATVNLYADHPVNIVQDPNVPSAQSLFYQLALIDQSNSKVVEVYTYPHDPNIKRIKGTFGGYVYYHYINNSVDNKCLAEVVKLGDSKNIAVCGEKSEEQFAVKLQPGQEKLVKMKISNQANGDYTFNPIINNQIIEKFTSESLLEMLKKKPTKVRQREIQHQKIQVYIKTFQYSGGVALLYVNQMNKYSYIEEINFEIRNLVLQNDKLQDDCKYHIELEPHAEKMLSFLIVDPSKSYTFKSKVEYYLGTPQFKF